jgi:hypothetical protein
MSFGGSINSYSLTSNIINITINQLEAYNISFNIVGIKNPLTSTTSNSWIIKAYSLNGILIASSTKNIFFTAACGTMCKSCINVTYCLSCYNNLIINSLNYFRTTVNTCASSCLLN